MSSSIRGNGGINKSKNVSPLPEGRPETIFLRLLFRCPGSNSGDSFFTHPIALPARIDLIIYPHISSRAEGLPSRRAVDQHGNQPPTTELVFCKVSPALHSNATQRHATCPTTIRNETICPEHLPFVIKLTHVPAHHVTHHRLAWRTEQPRSLALAFSVSTEFNSIAELRVQRHGT